MNVHVSEERTRRALIDLLRERGYGAGEVVSDRPAEDGPPYVWTTCGDAREVSVLRREAEAKTSDPWDPNEP